MNTNTGHLFDTDTKAQVRRDFEDSIWRYYAALKASGWKDPQEGDFTQESLFWRTPEGRYGVHSVEQAWSGFTHAAAAYYAPLRTARGALQEVARLVHVETGADVTLETLPAVQRLQSLAINSVRHLQALTEALHFVATVEDFSEEGLKTLEKARQFIADVIINVDKKGHL